MQMKHLNTQSPVPLYYQLADIILARIRSGEYGPGERVPSEHDLASAFLVGRPTVRQATERLVRQGVLIRRRGAGTFVRSAPREVDLFSLTGTIAAFQQKGISFRTQICRKTRLKRIKNGSQNPFSGRQAYFLSRLSRAEDRPVLIEDIFLDAALFPDFDRFDLTDRSLSQIVETHYYMRPVGGKQNFRIGYLDGPAARDLNVTANTPILIVNRFIHFRQAENAVYSELFCCTDQFVFSQAWKGPEYE